MQKNPFYLHFKLRRDRHGGHGGHGRRLLRRRGGGHLTKGRWGGAGHFSQGGWRGAGRDGEVGYLRVSERLLVHGYKRRFVICCRLQGKLSKAALSFLALKDPASLYFSWVLTRRAYLQR
jgi:hypothetical protein